MTRLGGIRAGAVKYSEWAQKVFALAVAHQRTVIQLPKFAKEGNRYTRDEAILARVESNYTEAEFMACPSIAVETMLLDAAQADWYYDNEKEYDDLDGTGEDDGESESDE